MPHQISTTNSTSCLSRKCRDLCVASFAALLSACWVSPEPETGSKRQTVHDSGAKPHSSTASFIVAEPGEGYLTPEILHSQPSLNGPVLRKPALSPTGERVTVLQGRDTDASQQDLWAYDVTTGEGTRLVSSTDILGAPEVLSEEEKNRRERQREYGSGIVEYSWAGPELLLFPLGGDIFVYDLKTQTPQQITATDGFETDAKVAPSASHVAYVRDNDLYVTTLESGLERQLTNTGTDVIRNATASFVVQEELDRNTGYWWSPDSQSLAYTRIDESPVAIESRINFGADGITNIAQRYPFAGTDNATVELGIVNRDGGETLWVDLGSDTDIYLTRVLWSPDSAHIWVGILSRDHKSHRFLKVDTVTSASELAFEETSPTWINVGTDLVALAPNRLIWSSEKDGPRTLYTIDMGAGSAAQWSPITPADVHVNGLSCVDLGAQTAYFTGWQESPLERHVFSVGLDGTNLTKISDGDGRHSAAFSQNCDTYIGTFSNPNTPPQTRVFSRTGEPLAWLNENTLDSSHPYAPYLEAHIAPEYGQINAADGTPLDYVLYKPLDLAVGEKRPSITLVYGGPGVQRVHKGWERRHFARMLAHHGFVVFQLENRGAANRGKAFEDPLYRAMGQIEVQDQSVGADWLKSQDFIDPDKMGVYGWSYGGYMALHMLAQTDLYASGVSGAPVTDWSLYDTAYTERYLGDPVPGRANYTQGAYETGSVFAHVEGLTEPFLLIHGMADDNVVFRHSVKLMDAMQASGNHSMRVMTYPGEKHGFRRTENRIHRDRQILEFFIETLSP